MLYKVLKCIFIIKVYIAYSMYDIIKYEKNKILAQLFSTLMIIRNVSWAPNEYIRFLKDDVTLKSRVMAAEN